jgi:hypothetical protein
MSQHKKPTYIIIQEAMADRIRFLEAEIDKLRVRCLDLQLENADYVWNDMCRSAIAYQKAEKRRPHRCLRAR